MKENPEKRRPQTEMKTPKDARSGLPFPVFRFPGYTTRIPEKSAFST